MFISRPQRITTQQEAIAILQKGEYGVLCTASPQGQPYGVPMNYCYSQQENSIYFHCALTGKKLENFMQNEKVSFVVVTQAQLVPESFTARYESVLVEGTVHIIADEQERIRIMKLICEGLTPENMNEVEAAIKNCMSQALIGKITVKGITGKKNTVQ